MKPPKLPSGFEYDEIPGRLLRVRTPLLYPDGSNIDVFLVEESDGRVTVTDYGNTETYLYNACVQTRGQWSVAQSCDVNYDNGELSRRSDDAESFAVTIILVAYACHAVSRNL